MWRYADTYVQKWKIVLPTSLILPTSLPTPILFAPAPSRDRFSAALAPTSTTNARFPFLTSLKRIATTENFTRTK